MSNYGQAALTIVGTVIGSYYCNPQLGFALGSLAGLRDGADTGKRREGARHRHRDRLHDGFGRLIPQHREAAHFAVLDLGTQMNVRQRRADHHAERGATANQRKRDE